MKTNEPFPARVNTLQTGTDAVGRTEDTEPQTKAKERQIMGLLMKRYSVEDNVWNVWKLEGDAAQWRGRGNTHGEVSCSPVSECLRDRNINERGIINPGCNGYDVHTVCVLMLLIGRVWLVFVCMCFHVCTVRSLMVPCDWEQPPHLTGLIRATRTAEGTIQDTAG
ncbi:hypothetical protein F2P81_024084 [Scophthalmus maximus]|uniref:Uncharacterized protein n=1 Tax=Scophthalmus maximus TaxID=52904 RepID=A0A6A4RYF0_SCOMX|nr:hypothetical protein F2P81_024084 [Scophthalmus maximus]